MLVGLGHIDLVCTDVERSLAFYAAVFGELGLQAPHEERGERGETIYYLRFPQDGSGSIGFRQAYKEQPFELYAPGFHHLAVAVERKTDVDLAHENAVGAGAAILHAAMAGVPPRLLRDVLRGSGRLPHRGRRKPRRAHRQPELLT